MISDADVIYSFKDLQVDFPEDGDNLTDVFLWNTDHASVFVQSTKPKRADKLVLLGLGFCSSEVLLSIQIHFCVTDNLCNTNYVSFQILSHWNVN